MLRRDRNVSMTQEPGSIQSPSFAAICEPASFLNVCRGGARALTQCLRYHVTRRVKLWAALYFSVVEAGRGTLNFHLGGSAAMT
jgi:hypothetical protein